MKSLKGHLLIAGDAMPDSIFRQSVVLMLEHNEQGALGVILNKRTDLSIADAWAQVSDLPCHSTSMVHVGGPCEGPLMVVHVHADHGQMDVMPGVFFSTDQSEVEWLIEHSAAPIRFFVGYSGWGPGQLEGELSQGDWQVLPASIDHVFHASEDMWQQLRERISQGKQGAAGLPEGAARLGVPARLIPRDPSSN